MPDNTPPAVNATPLGNVPLAVNVDAGPVAVTLKLPAVPTINVVVAALEIIGPVERVSVNVGRAAVEFAELPQLVTP